MTACPLVEVCRKYWHGVSGMLKAQAHHLVTKYLEVEHHFQRRMLVYAGEEQQPRLDRRGEELGDEEMQVFRFFRDQRNGKRPRGPAASPSPSATPSPNSVSSSTPGSTSLSRSSLARQVKTEERLCVFIIHYKAVPPMEAIRVCIVWG